MESTDVRLARIEERMVMIVHEQKQLSKAFHAAILKIGQKLDMLTERHWKLSGKQLGITATVSLLISSVTFIVVHLAGK